MLFGKKKKRIAFLLGCLWYYIKRIEDVNSFAEATEILTNTLTGETSVGWWRGGVEDRPGMEGDD